MVKILKYILFWIIYFEFSRIIFILFNTSELEDVSFVEILKTFAYGFKLDVSTTCYIGFFSMLFFIVSLWIRSPKFLKITLNIYTLILIASISLLIIGDAETFKSWAFRLDSNVLQYIITPKAASASLTTLRLMFLIFTYLMFTTAMFLLYYLIMWKKSGEKQCRRQCLYTFIYLIFGGLLIIPIRGGIGVAPINVGAVYFSDKMFLNQTAINVAWNFGNSMLSKDMNYEQFNFFDKEDCDEYFSELMVSDELLMVNDEKLINQDIQHIIIIVLESFSGNAIGAVGGEPKITPKLNEWSKKGILFDNFYASSDRSDKGLVSIFSSVPPLLSYSLMKNPQKSQHLNSFVAELGANGYKSSFYYGGDVNFANMNSYLKNAGFTNIYSQNNLKLNCKTDSKWGYHDECMFNFLYNKIISDNEKSIHALFTLSSHEPFETPGGKPFDNNSESNKMRNAYFYTDSCLNDFLNKLQSSPKWEKSLIILVADHSTRFPGNVDVWDLPKFKTFMLWLGGAINVEPFIYSKTADQLDIGATLLSQLKILHHNFIFSEDLFSKQSPCAFYSFRDGFGFIKDNQCYIYDTNKQCPIVSNIDSTDVEKYAKTFLQKLAEYYKSIEKY